MTDMLSTHKTIAGNLNMYAGEVSTQQAKGKLLNILEDVHDMQFKVFSEMEKRGWYKTKPAPKTEIQTAKTKYEQAKEKM